MADAGLATVTADDLASSPQYQSLLADCHEICERIRRNLLLDYWDLGQRIHRALPETHEERYGQELILSLEKDLVVDRTTLWRAVKFYRTHTRPEIVAAGENARLLTWSKVRMLLPLPDDLRLQIEERIRSGELRTDDDVRQAINLLKSDLGLLPGPAIGEVEPELFGVKGVSADKLRSLWRRAEPLDRCLLVRAMIPEMELEKADRREALAAIRATREQLDDYEQRLGEGAE